MIAALIRRPIGVCAFTLAMALLDDRVALLAGDVRERLELEDLLHLQVLVQRELDRAQIGLEMIDGCFGHTGGSS